MRKTGSLLFPYEYVETIIILVLLIIGFLVVHIVSNIHRGNTEKQASDQRDIYKANEMLNVISSTEINTSYGKKTIPQALDKYFYLKNYQYIYSSNKYSKNMTDLMTAITQAIDSSILYSGYFISVNLYRKKIPSSYKQILFKRYYTEFAYGYMTATAVKHNNKKYITSIILPSSIDRGNNYYINLSMYFYN